MHPSRFDFMFMCLWYFLRVCLRLRWKIELLKQKKIRKNFIFKLFSKVRFDHF
jgi:hypothetical protein